MRTVRHRIRAATLSSCASLFFRMPLMQKRTCCRWASTWHACHWNLTLARWFFLEQCSAVWTLFWLLLQVCPLKMPSLHHWYVPFQIMHAFVVKFETWLSCWCYCNHINCMTNYLRKKLKCFLVCVLVYVCAGQGKRSRLSQKGVIRWPQKRPHCSHQCHEGNC